jgi:hypothetical protein
MRALVIVAALAGTARADGAYIVGDLGATAFRGPKLDGQGAVRLRGGLGIAFGAWAVEGWFAGDVSNLFAYDGCACAGDAGGIPFAPSVGLETYGLDLRRDLPLVYGHPPDRLRFFRPRLSAFVHGGVREVTGDDGLTGYRGAGIGGGVGFEVNVRVFAAYVDFGLDRFELTAPGSVPIDGGSFHVVLGERIGFSL